MADMDVCCCVCVDDGVADLAGERVAAIVSVGDDGVGVLVLRCGSVVVTGGLVAVEVFSVVLVGGCDRLGVAQSSVAAAYDEIISDVYLEG